MQVKKKMHPHNYQVWNHTKAAAPPFSKQETYAPYLLLSVIPPGMGKSLCKQRNEEMEFSGTI